MARQGRYQDVTANLRVKEVKISDTERFVVCHNPDAADRDAAVRANLVARLEAMIAGSDRLPATKRAELRGVISTKPGLNRFLRVTPGGLLRIDAAKITADAKLDGKYLLRTSDPHLSTEDIALGYKQLLEVERGWRDMKQVLDLRPVYHRLEDRIRAHVLLCWLALLLARIVETRASTPDTTTTWPRARDQLQRLHVGTFTGPAGLFRQTTPPSPEARRLHQALDIALPPRILDLDPEQPQRADQAQHPRLVTRHVTRPAPVCPAQTPYPGTFTAEQLRNPGRGGSRRRRAGQPGSVRAGGRARAGRPLQRARAAGPDRRAGRPAGRLTDGDPVAAGARAARAAGAEVQYPVPDDDVGAPSGWTWPTRSTGSASSTRVRSTFVLGVLRDIVDTPHSWTATGASTGSPSTRCTATGRDRREDQPGARSLRRQMGHRRRAMIEPALVASSTPGGGAGRAAGSRRCTARPLAMPAAVRHPACTHRRGPAPVLTRFRRAG